jgi:putative membrane protein
MRTGLILSLLLAILAVVFAVQNLQPMEVDLLFFETEGSAALILILTFGLGVTVGLLSSLPGRLRARRELKKLRKQQGNGSSDRSASGSASASESSKSGRSAGSSAS